MLKILLLGVLMSVSMPILAQTAPSANRPAKKVVLPQSAQLPVVRNTVRKELTEPVEIAENMLSAEQLTIADKVFLGKITCELGVHVTIARDTRTAGKFVLDMGREKHVMAPVATSTGAVRLEDAKSGAVWLQLSNKSMLMNQKLGKRMADDCMNADQLQVAQEMARTPPPSLLEPVRAEMAPADSATGVRLRAVAYAIN